MSHTGDFFALASAICADIDVAKIEQMVDALAELRVNPCGRLFILGVGGSAANASHACNDFRKLCGIEAYCPTDNVAELTARTNDNGWRSVFGDWLNTSRLSETDAVLVLSVGGGHDAVSANLIDAIQHSKDVEATVLAIVGDATGYAARHADIALVVPAARWKTPLTESFQSLVWHCLVSHPKLQINKTVW